MRITALIVSILLALAPWSGAMAYAVLDSGKTETAAVPITDRADHAMPCHAEQPQANPACDSCGHNSCDMGDCQQCANAVAGILPAFDCTAPVSERELFVYPKAIARLHDLIPESPPPIA